MNQNVVNTKEEKELSIDFIALWKVLIVGKWKIILVGFVVSLLTAISLFNTPNEYTSTASVMPELQTSALSGLSKYAGLASPAGINLSDMAGSDAVRPDLYPNVINNTSFFLYLLEQPIRTSDNKSLKFWDFYVQKYDLDTLKYNENGGILESVRGLLGIQVIKNQSVKDLQGKVVFISKIKGFQIENKLMKKIIANIDKKTGVISVSVELPDPVTAAHVAQISMNYLTDFVTKYRVEKAKTDADFLASQLKAARGQYYSSQAQKAEYSDQFQLATIRLQSADIKRERIESDYRVNSAFYQQLLQQYEMAKLKVQQETPIFKTLQKPVVPYEKSGPRRLLYIIFTGFLSLGISIPWIILRKGVYKNLFTYQ